MPNPEVAILIRGVDRATGVFRKLSSSTSGIFSAMARTVAIAGAGLAASAGIAIGAFTKLAFEAAKQQETFDLLADQVERTGTSWISVRDDVKGLADELQALTRYGDVETAYVLQDLTTYTGDLGQSMEYVMTVYDLAAAKHMDYATSAKYVGMALAGSIEMLGRYIPELRASSGLVDKNATASEKAAVAMELLNTKFGGAAQAQLRNFMGYWIQMKNYMGDLREAIGDLVIPMFEDLFQTITAEMSRAITVIESGRFDYIFEGWGEAAKAMIMRISEALAVVGPFILEEFGRMGDIVARFFQTLDVETIRIWTEKMVSFGKTLASVTFRVAEFTLEHGKMILALAGLMILGSLATQIITFTQAIAGAAIAIKGFALAHTTLMAAMGPVGLALAAGGLLITGLVLLKKQMKGAADETRKFREEMAQLEIEKVTEGLTEEKDAVRALIGAEISHIRIIASHRKRLIGLIEARKEGTITSKEYRREQYYLLKQMRIHVDRVKNLREEIDRLSAATKEQPFIGPPTPPPPPPEEVVPKEIIQLREALNMELERLTLSEIEFEKAELRRWTAEKLEMAKDDAEATVAIREIERLKLEGINAKYAQNFFANSRARLKAILQESLETMKIRMRANIALLRAQGKETEAFKKETELRRLENVGLYGDLAIAQSIYAAEMDQFRAAELSKDEATNLEKLNLKKSLEIKILEAEGNRREAALKGLEMEIEQWETRGAEGIALEDYRRARQKAINEFYDKEETKAAQVKIDKIQSAEESLRNTLATIRMDDFEKAMFAIDQEIARYEEMGVNKVLLEDMRRVQTEEIKQAEVERIIELEEAKISEMQNLFSGYAGLVIDLGEDIFSSQEGGWLRAIASIIRWGSKLLSQYLLTQAFEKTRQKGFVETASLEARLHGQKMARMAAEFALQGDLVRAGIAGAKSLLGFAEAGALMVEAEALGKQAKTLTVAAVAAEAAGEIAAGLVGNAAKEQREAAKESERFRKEKARAEKKIQADIISFERGRAGLETQRLQEQIKEYRQLGIETGLLERWQTAREAEVAEMAGATRMQPAPPQFPETIPAPASAAPMFQDRLGAQVIINQTINIDGWINTADREHLLKLGEKMVPYNEQIEKQWRTG